MKGFIQIVTDEISKLKSSQEYVPGGEASILVPMTSKPATLKGVPLDDAKIKYIEYPYRINTRDGRYFELKPGEIICRITGRIR